MTYYQAMAGTPTDAGSGVELLRSFGRNMMDAVSAVPGLWWTVGEADPDSNITRILVAATQRGLNRLGAKIPEDGVFGTKTRQTLARMARGRSYLKWQWWEVFEELARGERMEDFGGLQGLGGLADEHDQKLAYAKGGEKVSAQFEAATNNALGKHVANAAWAKAVTEYHTAVVKLGAPGTISTPADWTAALQALARGDTQAKIAKAASGSIAPPAGGGGGGGGGGYVIPETPPLTSGFGSMGMLPMLALGIGAGFLLLGGKGKKPRTTKRRRR
jgi:hypothetical protein